MTTAKKAEAGMLNKLGTDTFFPRSVVVGAPLLADLRQQLLPKCHLPQTPTASHRRPDFPPALLPLPFLHPLFKHAPPRRAVFRNAVLAQPAGPLAATPAAATTASNTPCNCSSDNPVTTLQARATSPAPDSNAHSRTPSSDSPASHCPRSAPCSGR